MPKYVVATPHYGYSAIKFREYQTTYAVYRFPTVTSAWTPIDVATSESEAISKCKYLEATRSGKTK